MDIFLIDLSVILNNVLTKKSLDIALKIHKSLEMLSRLNMKQIEQLHQLILKSKVPIDLLHKR